MKWLSSMAVLLALFSLTGITSAIAGSGGGPNVVLTNNTSYTVNELYASGSDVSGWDVSPSNNLLNGQIVQPGQSVTISIPGSGGDGGCSYDLMAVLYGASQYAYQYQVNACDGGGWTISSSF